MWNIAINSVASFLEGINQFNKRVKEAVSAMLSFCKVSLDSSDNDIPISRRIRFNDDPYLYRIDAANIEKLHKYKEFYLEEASLDEVY